MLQLHAVNPTIDIYFREPLRSLISELPWTFKHRPISRFGTNSFATNDVAVIIRYATLKEIDRIARKQFERVYYVVDDDFQRVADDISLPDDYRRRLSSFAHDQLPRILDLADVIVSPSWHILRSFSGHACEQLAPAAYSISNSFNHFDEVNLRAVFPGTRSHVGDLSLIIPAVTRAIDAHKGFSFTTYLGKAGEAVLPSRPGIVHLPPQSWRRYRRTLRTKRYHLSLSPYRDTAFNQARSINKIHDAAAFGAAGLFSARPPLSDVVRDDETGLLISDQETDWSDKLNSLISDPRRCCRLAVANAQLSAKIGNPARVRAFWLERLFADQAAKVPRQPYRSM